MISNGELQHLQEHVRQIGPVLIRLEQRVHDLQDSQASYLDAHEALMRFHSGQMMGLLRPFARQPMIEQFQEVAARLARLEQKVQALQDLPLAAPAPRALPSASPVRQLPAATDAAAARHLAPQIARLEQRVQELLDSHTIYLGDHEALTRLHTGHRVYVDTRDVGICSHLMLQGRWEGWIEEVVRRLVKPGMQVVDAGANFGYYTLLMADWVGAAGHVHAFEANPHVFAKLRKSVAVNGFDDRASLFQVALHDQATQLDFRFTHEFSGGGSTLAGAHPVFKTECVSVRALPLDILLAEVPSVQVMKIDIEGSEPLALAGARDLLARSPDLAMVVEFAPDASALQDDPLRYLRSFGDDGFALRLIEPAHVTDPLTPEECLERLAHGLGYLLVTRGATAF